MLSPHLLASRPIKWDNIKRDNIALVVYLVVPMVEPGQYCLRNKLLIERIYFFDEEKGWFPCCLLSILGIK